MKNFKKMGAIITAEAPGGGVVSGDAVLIGALFGLAQYSADAGDPVELITEGVFEMPKPGSQSWSIGDAIYFDESSGEATTNDATGSNLLIGYAVSVVGSGAAETVGDVRLHGGAVT